MSDILIWQYSLKSGSRLNAASPAREHAGALIRVGDGFGCLHPWPELGDDDIGTQLNLLAEGKISPLIRQALECAAVDGAARREGRSLFQTPVPESHWLVLPDDDPAEVREAGFQSAKIKVGSDLSSERRTAMVWAAAGFRLRLDANETLSLSTFLDFWATLKPVRDLIDWVEDPTLWHRDQWSVLREAAIPVGVDRDLETRFESGYTAIVKPAVSAWTPPGEESFVVTSYMDHAIGQAWAASEAARLAASPAGVRMSDCGLLTHRCFEGDEFFERFETDGSRLLSPGGTGLGFDDLLEALPWKRLT